jgi:hypothetical protein
MMIKRQLWMMGLLLCCGAYAQNADSTQTAKKDWLNFLVKEDYGKNVIKYNIMATMIFGDPKNAAVTYERVITDGQSLSVGGGYLTFPSFMNRMGNVTDVTVTQNAGFIGLIDYRFYLRKLNRRPTLNGIYIGPYYSIYKYSGAAHFVYQDNGSGVPVNYEATMATNFTFNNIGFQLGYQFIFFKRLSLDLILCGPAYSFYDIEVDLKSNLSADQKSRVYQRYKESFLSKTPLFQSLMEKANFERTGVSSGYMPNFRYTFQIGWHF